MEKLYTVSRMFQDGRNPIVQKTNLTLAQAQAHCENPQTSSMTARKPYGCDQDQKQIDRWHEKQKHWFDGFTEQR